MTAVTDRRRALLRRAGIGVAVTSAALLAFALGCASTGPGQPHMRAALDELRSARTELDQALADKGGHRVRAIGLVDSAISEVQAGMEHARER